MLLEEDAIGRQEVDIQEEPYQVEGTVEYLWVEEEQLRIRLATGKAGKVLLLLKWEPEGETELPKIGNRLAASGKQWEFTGSTVPGQFDERSYYQASGYRLRLQVTNWQVTDTRVNWWRQRLWQLRQNLSEVYERLLPAEKAGVLSAMLLGEKQKLDSEIKTGYQNSGISHVLAVSGLHVSLLGGAVLYLLRKLRVCPRIIADGIAIFLIVSYGVLLDYPVSASRAVMMIVLSIMAGMIGRTYDMPTAFSCALLFLVLQEPSAAYQAGFQLSFGAVVGIWLLYPVLERNQPNSAWKKAIQGSLLTSLSVLLLTLPVQMYHFYEISLPGLWNNLLVLPVMPLLLLTGLAGGFLGLLPGAAGIFLGRFCLGSTCAMLQFYEWVCGLSRWTGWAVQTTGRPTGGQIWLYYGMIALALFLHKRDRKKEKQRQETGESVSFFCRIRSVFLLGAGVLLLLVRVPVTKVTFLDVGQGDGIVVQSALGNTFLVDGGSSSVSGVGKWRLLPFLKQEGIRRIDGVLVTHMDGDHISGILELLEEGEIPIKTLWLPVVYQKQEVLREERYQSLLEAAKKRRVQIGYLEPGDRLRDGKIVFCCLGPEPGRVCKEQNSASLILNLLIGDTSLLLTGDMGKQEERWLIETQKETAEEGEAFDILKVGHHGSKNSSGEEFLEWCGAKVALISSSFKNRYGHPHEETLERLSAAGYQSFGTAWSGSIQVRWGKDGTFRLWHYGGERGAGKAGY